MVGVAVCMTVADPVLRVALAVGLAISATIAARALHPPAGAVAMVAALSPGRRCRPGSGLRWRRWRRGRRRWWRWAWPMRG
ncbi:MAG: HPP family protein [Paracoccaceae bacterium]